MAAAKADNETDRTRVLQEMFKRKNDEAQSPASNTDKKFNVATKADSVLILRDGSTGRDIERYFSSFRSPILK
ncbi:hypothetical protein BD410DRAFT_846681 [Rickenella mellea]|uniref:Uncharacterized protein n=1 Tax=Rickenella mellea TaxID=50990 RepID=A0A4Y7PEI1_9AGAM|nr:hypothetical protein BD410DRAFT_846681 [Rickenella mellea]